MTKKQFTALSWVSYRVLAAWVAALLVAQSCWSASAEEPSSPAAGVEKESAPAAQFIRVRRDDEKKPLALETAIVRFTAAEGPHAGASVDLVGVVHVGEKAYYDELNKRFTAYDAVLYELVAAEGQNVPQPGQRRGGVNPVGAVQMGMKNMLELEFQLDHIDYSLKNMVHADMSPREFSATMKDRGESFLELFFRMMGQGAAQQSKDPGRSNDLRLFSALFSRDRAKQLKQVMAEQFESMDGTIGALDGPDGSTIITERNKKAFAVLAEQLQAGKKQVAVFYGAGHLPDMQRRLEADFGMKRQGEEWLTAWSLAAKPAAK
ncbi:MAG: hypothetical protein J5I93_05420 [Pirellulaceae bacterium]|nr:hypothetical protein [Pirellulaceae bacterium]